MILVDNIRVHKYSLQLKRCCQCCLVGYVVAFIIRMSCFFSVHASMIKIDPENTSESGFGSFFAEYVNQSATSIVITVVLLFLFVLFYISNFWAIRQMNKILEFARVQQEDLLISKSILINKEVKTEAEDMTLNEFDITKDGFGTPGSNYSRGTHSKYALN